ncbi:uncharacterized protein EDB93DRAFT_1286229 [Suillus bovinus]|uniref:uncharacterized protein n=1 Tax=Suillus bovinus TaxID=48563 RepID=UPI001B85F341|nr:uncharacterized protein EDB93DRAFT_1286229 [Suillus bovinus]KAG2146110.1 hypothetical protein EDB93DRAFT_1286229 [Suillus bovinus]
MCGRTLQSNRQKILLALKMIPPEIQVTAWAFLLDTLLRIFNIRVTQALYTLPYLQPYLLLGPSSPHLHSKNGILPEGLAHFQPSFSTSIATSSPISSYDKATTTLTLLSPTSTPWVLDPLAEPSHAFWFHNPPPGALHPSQKRMRNVIFPSWVRQQEPAPGEKQHKALAPFSPRIITFCPVLLFTRYALTLSAAYLILSVLAMLVAAPFERSSEVVVCDALLINPGVASLMRGIFQMIEPGAAVARCVVAFPMPALRWSWSITKEVISKLGYCLRTGTARLVKILAACFSKVTHISSIAVHYTTIFVVTARRWPLFMLNRFYSLLAACLCWISMGIEAIHYVVQRKPATKTQIPIITITPAENDETSACESVDIAALLEEISDGTTGLEPHLGDASPSSEDCLEDGIIDELQIDKPLLHTSCGQISGEDELLVIERHALLGGQEVHTDCSDLKIRLDAPDDTVPDAITGKPEIYATCSRDSGGPVVVKIEGPEAYSPLVPSGDDEATATASIPCKTGYPITRLTPKERAPDEQPMYSEGAVYKKTIPGSAELGAMKQKGFHNNRDVVNPCVVIDVPELKGPSHCPGTKSSVDESPSDPAADSIKLHGVIQADSLTPSHSAASEPSLIIHGENERRFDNSTVHRQENSDQREDNSPNKMCLAPGNEMFMPEAIMETKELAFIPSSAPQKTHIKEDVLFMTMPEASIHGEFSSVQLSAHDDQPSTSQNTKGCPPSMKEGPTKIASDDKLYSASNSNLEGQETNSEMWDFLKLGTNAPFHRLLSASIHAPSAQSSESIQNHCIGETIESGSAMPQSGRPPHVLLSENFLNHHAGSFTPQGLVLKSTLMKYDPPLRLVGPGLEQGDHALNVNLPNPTPGHSRKYMTDLPDHIALKAYRPRSLHSARAYATHRNVPPRMTVSGSNHIKTHRGPSTHGPVPDWAAEAAAERRFVDMHISAPKVYLGTSAAHGASLHQPSGTTTLRMPISEDIFSPAPQRVTSKVARWAAEVNRAREPAMSQIFEGSSLDAQVKGCRQGTQQTPLLLNRKTNTTLSRDDMPTVFPSAAGAAYHSQGPVSSEFAKRAVEMRDKEQTKTVQGQYNSYYESLCARNKEDIILEARHINADMGKLPSTRQSPTTMSDLSLNEWFSRARNPISGDDIERMIRVLERGA